MSLRLADLLSGLSRLADLGFGLDAGESLRSCALAALLARDLDLPDADVRAALYTALLHHVGCTGYAHETARIFGNEIAFNAAAARTNHTDFRDMFATFLPTFLAGQPPLQRARLVFAAVTQGSGFDEAFTSAACEVGRRSAARLLLPDEVQRSVYHVYEHWQGGGDPDGLAGDEIPIGSRIARLTGIATLFDTMGGVDVAADAIRRRAGGMLDPALSARFADQAQRLLGEVNARDPRAIVLEAEPAPHMRVMEPDLADVATVFGDIADLKTPFTHGHSRGVAALARKAGEKLGLSRADVGDLEVAALLHDVGRVAISDQTWDKSGRLTGPEHEQVRLHPYHSERILAGSERLQALAPAVGMHHERVDGSGYHRGCNGADIPIAARILAAADAYQAMTQARPHRPARAPEEAAEQVRAGAGDGALDPDVVSAVLAAAGHDDVPVRREPPAGLTDREVQVLALVASGCSNAEVAKRLVISKRTAEHHVQHIYGKLGVSSRAAAAVFAMEHDLLAASP